jgi:hypothetical protein
MEPKRPNRTKTLKPKQQVFVAEMANGATIGQAVEAAGISRSQGKRWLTHPHPVSVFLQTSLEESQTRLAERLPRLIDLALSHAEYVLTRPDGTWNDAKAECNPNDIE